MRIALACLPLFAVLASCAETPKQRIAAADRAQKTQAYLDKALAGLTPGKPVSCLPFIGSSISTQAYGPTILYTASPRQVYRNDTNGGGCEGAARGDVLVSVQLEGRACAGDIVRTVDQVSRVQTGSCSLGQFIPYTR